MGQRPEGERPLLILTSEQVSREYLAYLDRSRISWIACGAERIDLPRACDILAQDFGVKRMAVVGGGHVNAGFLAAGLLDEVSVLVGAGVDGRGGPACGVRRTACPAPGDASDAYRRQDL